MICISFLSVVEGRSRNGPSRDKKKYLSSVIHEPSEILFPHWFLYLQGFRSVWDRCFPFIGSDSAMKFSDFQNRTWIIHVIVNCSQIGHVMVSVVCVCVCVFWMWIIMNLRDWPTPMHNTCENKGHWSWKKLFSQCGFIYSDSHWFWFREQQ